MDAWLLSLAASPLVYPGMFLFAVMDGFFPPSRARSQPWASPLWRWPAAHPTSH